MSNYDTLANLIESRLVDSRGQKLVYDEIPSILNIYQQGQYSSEIAALNTSLITEISYPQEADRPPIKELRDMAQKDPMVNKCASLKSLRVAQNFGNYTHPKKEIESFINSNFGTLNKSFKSILFKAAYSVVLYGYVIIEFTLTSKARGYQGQWRLGSLNVLNPERILKFIGKDGHIDAIQYDNGDGKTVNIPYKKCIHIINQSGAAFDEYDLFGVGDGIAALNYYKLKKIVLTQLALATKNNATGIVHVKVPNTGRTILVDSKMNPIKDSSGKPMEVTKQIALNYQLQDLYKKDYIVTDTDVEMDRIQIQNEYQFWEYILGYIDRSIQQAFGVPVGIFDSGTTGLQDIGLSQNFKSIFDSTIYSLTTLFKEEITNKVVKRLLNYNFPPDWFANNYGEFVFDIEEDPTLVNNQLSTISSLIASGILDMNDVEVIALIRKKLGLPALTEEDKFKKEEDALDAKIQAEVQKQLEIMTLQMQLQQMQQPPMPEEGGDYPAEQ